MPKYIITLLFFSFISNCAISQSTSIKAFVENQENIKQYFVYQSVIRILNIDGNKDFNKLIKNVDRIVVHAPRIGKDSTGVTQEIYKDLVNSLHAECF